VTATHTAQRATQLNSRTHTSCVRGQGPIHDWILTTIQFLLTAHDRLRPCD